MVSGHLQEKKGNYYIVLNYKDSFGKRKNKWISTDLPVKGNKKRAEALLLEARRSFTPEEQTPPEELLFSDFLLNWLKIIRPSLSETTYATYYGNATKTIAPYFRKAGITLQALKPIDIQNFYLIQLERVKAMTVVHYHALIHKVLKYAVKLELIPSNPADRVERPKPERYAASFYDAKETEALFAAAKGTALEIPVFLGAFYGLRRSEVIGLKWSAINFEQSTITVDHTVTSFYMNGTRTDVAKDSAKTKSSLRTLPLVPAFRAMLLQQKEHQQEYRRLCGRSYDLRYLDYICVNAMGELLKPQHLTRQFKALLEKNSLRPIRFHDLRHSCASLMLANGVPMKHIQEWLGHSDFSTTANIYSHLDYQAKISSAEAMSAGLSGALSALV